MSDQGSLFYPLATYENGSFPGSESSSSASRDAARSISTEIERRQMEVLKALVVMREATPQEIAAKIGRHPYVTSPRVTELQKRGFVTRTGEVRLTPARRFAHVVRLTESGVKYLRENVPNVGKV